MARKVMAAVLVAALAAAARVAASASAFPAAGGAIAATVVTAVAAAASAAGQRDALPAVVVPMEVVIRRCTTPLQAQRLVKWPTHTIPSADRAITCRVIRRRLDRADVGVRGLRNPFPSQHWACDTHELSFKVGASFSRGTNSRDTWNTRKIEKTRVKGSARRASRHTCKEARQGDWLFYWGDTASVPRVRARDPCVARQQPKPRVVHRCRFRACRLSSRLEVD